jgi:hypothetical protein
VSVVGYVCVTYLVLRITVFRRRRIGRCMYFVFCSRVVSKDGLRNKGMFMISLSLQTLAMLCYAMLCSSPTDVLS